MTGQLAWIERQDVAGRNGRAWESHQFTCSSLGPDIASESASDCNAAGARYWD
jgi:hypothetical protein